MIEKKILRGAAATLRAFFIGRGSPVAARVSILDIDSLDLGKFTEDEIELICSARLTLVECEAGRLDELDAPFFCAEALDALIGVLSVPLILGGRRDLEMPVGLHGARK